MEMLNRLIAVGATLEVAGFDSGWVKVFHQVQPEYFNAIPIWIIHDECSTTPGLVRGAPQPFKAATRAPERSAGELWEFFPSRAVLGSLQLS